MTLFGTIRGCGSVTSGDATHPHEIGQCLTHKHLGPFRTSSRPRIGVRLDTTPDKGVLLWIIYRRHFQNEIKLRRGVFSQGLTKRIPVPLNDRGEPQLTR